jgi:hypothetical protein
MHPEISRHYGEQHRAELHRQAERWRLAARARRPRPARLAMLWTVGPFAARRGPALWRRRGHGAGAPQAAPLGVFMAGPDAFGFRTYLTADEARQLAADWAAMLARFGDRAEDPSRRPDDAAPFEVVVLGRQVPDLVAAARGLPGPDRPGQAN